MGRRQVTITLLLIRSEEKTLITENAKPSCRIEPLVRASESRERPILFSGPMVRAILAGKKTQTRRLVKDARLDFVGGGGIKGPQWNDPNSWGFEDDQGRWWLLHSEGSDAHQILCPHGCPGDRLWVRETWTPDHAAFYPNFPYVYRADRGHDYERNDKGEVYSPEQKNWYPYRWRPSIHMPRAASRINIEITGVRVERLNAISAQDSLAEGIMHSTLNDPRVEFRHLWESINGSDSWGANPWVWVLGFKVI